MSVVLYSYVSSPFAGRLHTALRLKSIAFDVCYVNPLRLKKQLPVGHQIPVLSINGQHHRDSAAILGRIDALFPEAPRRLNGSADLQGQLTEIERWVTSELIPAAFRRVATTDAGWLVPARTGMRLGSIMHLSCDGGLPLWLRLAWPLVLRQASFVREQTARLDRTEPIEQMNARFLRTIDNWLDHDRFLAGSASPTVADASVYSQLVFPALLSLPEADYWRASEKIVRWVERVTTAMADGPALLPSALTVNH